MNLLDLLQKIGKMYLQTTQIDENLVGKRDSKQRESIGDRNMEKILYKVCKDEWISENNQKKKWMGWRGVRSRQKPAKLKEKCHE